MKKVLSVLCAVILIISSSTILTYAQEKPIELTSEEKNEILSCSYVGGSNIDGISSQDLSLVETISENVRTITTYYIPLVESGDMLTHDVNTYSFYTSDYNSLATTQKWCFNEVETGVYTIHPANEMNKCLTADVGSNLVYIMDYTGTHSNQNWSMEYSNTGNYLVCEADNSEMNGLQVLISSSGYTLAEIGTKMGFFEENFWIPTASIEQNDVLMYWGDVYTIRPTFKDASDGISNCNSNWWVAYTRDTYSSEYTLSQNVITAIGACYERTITITHKVTNVTDTFKLTIQPMREYLDIDYVATADDKNWCWAACAEMIGKKYTPASEETQYDVVNEIYGTLFNWYPTTTGGTPADIVEGAEIVAGKELTATIQYSIPTWRQICQYLRQGKPIVALLGIYNDGVRTDGHAVVIRGASIARHNGEITYLLNVIDPSMPELYAVNPGNAEYESVLQNLEYTLEGIIIFE